MNGRSAVMPILPFDELLRIKPANMSDSVAEFRFDVFGGSARNFINVNGDTLHILPVVEETMKLIFPDVEKLQHESLISVCIQVSSALNRRTIARINSVNSMMWHTQRDSSKSWASKFMAWLAAAIVDKRTADITDELEDFVGKS